MSSTPPPHETTPHLLHNSTLIHIHTQPIASTIPNPVPAYTTDLTADAARASFRQRWPYPFSKSGEETSPASRLPRRTQASHAATITGTSQLHSFAHRSSPATLLFSPSPGSPTVLPAALNTARSTTYRGSYVESVCLCCVVSADPGSKLPVRHLKLWQESGQDVQQKTAHCGALQQGERNSRMQR